MLYQLLCFHENEIQLNIPKLLLRTLSFNRATTTVDALSLVFRNNCESMDGLSFATAIMGGGGGGGGCVGRKEFSISNFNFELI